MKKMIVFLLVITTIATSCTKEVLNNGSILARVLYQDEEIANARVCIYTDLAKTPIECKTTDAIGEAYFDELFPGTYYIVGDGTAASVQKEVTGSTVVQITKKLQQNHYTAYIRTAVK